MLSHHIPASHCTLRTVNCPLGTMNCALGTMHCTLGTINCILGTLDCTFRTVICLLSKVVPCDGNNDILSQEAECQSTLADHDMCCLPVSQAQHCCTLITKLYIKPTPHSELIHLAGLYGQPHTQTDKQTDKQGLSSLMRDMQQIAIR